VQHPAGAPGFSPGVRTNRRLLDGPIQGRALALLRHNFHSRSRTSPRHPAQRLGATRRWITCRRTSGSVGRCVVSLRRGFIFGKPHVKEEGEGDHGEHGVVMKAKPGAAFEVVQAEFLLGLLVHLFAGPSSLDGSYDLLV
jgi:hypothetical protein